MVSHQPHKNKSLRGDTLGWFPSASTDAEQPEHAAVTMLWNVQVCQVYKMKTPQSQSTLLFQKIALFNKVINKNN